MFKFYRNIFIIFILPYLINISHTYAIGIFVDKNYNNKMDRNLFGVPKEQFGFSNNAKGNFGPPSFKDASFVVSGDINLDINL